MTPDDDPPRVGDPVRPSDPVNLDTRRGMAAQKATDERRRDRDVDDADATEERRRLDELEALAEAGPATAMAEAVARAVILIRRFADTSAGQDPRCKAAIARTLDDLDRLARHVEVPPEPAP